MQPKKGIKRPAISATTRLSKRGTVFATRLPEGRRLKAWTRRRVFRAAGRRVEFSIVLPVEKPRLLRDE